MAEADELRQKVTQLELQVAKQNGGKSAKAEVAPA